MSSIHVAVGVVKNSQGEICIAKRPEGKHMGGFWEFPGGKVELDESVSEALARELKEELSITIHSTKELIKIHHEYPEKKVTLDVHVVSDFSGEAIGLEDQKVLWVAPEELNQYQFPDANGPIIDAILNR